MDHYATLGVNKDATPDEIKKAYRKLASQHHPDKGGDKAKFQEIQEAYATLSDPDKRNQYDNPQPQGFNMGPGGFQFHMGPGVDINDIFGQMFGAGNPFGQQRSQRQVLRTQIRVSLIEAYNGGNQVLKVNTPQGTKVVDVTIPKGVQTGQQAKYENVIPNAVLLIEFIVIPDLVFERRGNDLMANHSVSVLDLIVGTTFQFTTISDKTVEVKIPPKTQPYMMLKISGYGMPVSNTGYYGDQLILLKPFIPDNISTDIVDSILRNRGN
jgi:DnaJ-class molecular chaperone